MRPWRIARRAVVEAAGLAHLHPLLCRLYAARGVQDAAELAPDLDALLPAGALDGIERATALLAAALAGDQRVLVVGDYDADGATSCALAVLGLRRLGARHADYLVPDRRVHGYGLTPEIVAVARERAPALIVTVDNGIASHAGVAAARAAGIRVLVTDHHLPGATLPDADAIVNPNLPGDPFPSKALAGVGVMFYVLVALRQRLRADGWFAARGTPEPKLAELLDLVALGTVADVATLDANNRRLVAQGLARLRAGRGRPGIAALAEVGKRRLATLTAQDLGYTIGPRLNAAGRLDDMARGVELLLTDDMDRARAIALELDGLNRERRELEAGMQDQALARVATLGAALPWGLCLHDDAWHPGVVGLVASRVKERVHRPVIAFAPGDDGALKGSARSIAGFHVRDALETVATRHPGLIERFGGHAMAAGLTLAPARFAAFAAAFDAVARERLDPAALEGVLWSDGELPSEWLTVECAELLRAGGPWGQGFPEPLFDGVFTVLERRVVGGRHLKLRVAPAGGGRALDALAFGWDAAPPTVGARLRLAYQLDVDEWRGEVGPRLTVRHLEEIAGTRA